MSDAPNPKIYLLPNLMTAGNLFCGFAPSSASTMARRKQALVRPRPNFTTRSGSFSPPVFSICSMDDWRDWADMKALSGESLIH
jgi:hypothetical protein